MPTKQITSVSMESVLEVVLETALDAAIAINDVGDVVAWNKVAEQTFGWKSADATGRKLSELIVPVDLRELHDGGLERYLQTGVAHVLGKHIEVEGINRDGFRFPVELSTTEFVRNGERLIVGFLRDISRRKEAEEQVRQVRERLDLAVHVHSIGVFDSNFVTGEVHWNIEAERIYGYAPGEIQITIDAWRSHVLDIDLERIDEIYKQAPIDNSREISYEFRIRRRDGVIRNIESSAKLFYDDNGNLVRRVGVNIDVTERRAAERRLAETQAELIHVSRLNSLGAIASSLGHELNQPLQAIGSYIHAAKRTLEQRPSPSDDIAIAALDAAIETTMKAGRLIKQLRTMASKGEVRPTKVNVLSIVTETALLVRDEAQEGSIKVNISFEDVETTAFADPVLLQQVVFNLLKNALQALEPTGGCIDIVGSVAGPDAIQIEIADNGPGLAEQIASNPFAAFASTKADGMGVGLSICRTIVEKLGGRISVKSSELGTSFFFTLPRVEPSAGSVALTSVDGYEAG